MKLTFGLFCSFVLIITIGAPPVVENVNKNKPKVAPQDAEDAEDVLDNLEYGRYLREVVDILESDPEFKKKLEKSSLEDIKSGNIAEHLSLVQHHIRTKLDEAKQREMQRLREYVGEKLRRLTDSQRRALARADPNGVKLRQYLPQHVDHSDSELFGQRDLERLIQHATKDLDEIDRKRQEQFKEYEMQKEYKRRAKLTKLNAEERRRLEQLHQEALEKKKRHPKVNHPGSVDQMEEVWEEVDHLEASQFTPKSFFKLHDINGDGYLDEGEIEALMLKEAAKIHENQPEADPVEEQEEMDRMREHVMKEFDKDNDRMLSLHEFETGVNGTGAKNDQGWQSIEDSTVYSDVEFEHFSEKLAPISTSIPANQTPAPAANQPNQVQPEAAGQAPPPVQPNQVQPEVAGQAPPLVQPNQVRPEAVAQAPPPGQPAHIPRAPLKP